MKISKKKKAGGISVRKFNLLMAILSLVLFCLLTYYTYNISSMYQQTVTQSQTLSTYEANTTNLEKDKIYLTQQVRLYVQNTDPVYMHNYFEGIDDNLEVKKELEKLNSNDVAKDIEAIVEDVVSIADSLTEKELYAMRLITVAKGTDNSEIADEVLSVKLSEEDAALSPQKMIEKARDTVFGEKYQELYSRFGTQIDKILNTVTLKLKEQQQITDRKIKFKMKYQQIIIVLLMLQTVVTYLIFLFFVMRPLNKHVQSIKKNQKFQVIGSEELRHLALSYNKLYKNNAADRDELLSRAEKDPLTGLMNQRGYDALKQKLATYNGPLAVVVIDIDMFKHINDEFGHETGDRVIKKIARCIRHSFHPEDYVIRSGGDEFIVIMLDIKRSESNILERRISQINKRLVLPTDDLPPTSVSVGAAFSEDGFKEELFQQADQAMYHVKHNGRCGLHIYNDASGLRMASAGQSDVVQKPCILLVDDSQTNRETLSAMLEDSYNIVCADNSRQAIENIEKRGHDFSLVLLDLQIPENDGYEVMSYIIKHRWNDILPVIIISSENDPSHIAMAYDMGAMDYISRPFDIQVVRRRVDNAVKLYFRYKWLADIVVQQIKEHTLSYDRMMYILSQVVEFRNHDSGMHVLHINLITDLLLKQLVKKTSRYGLSKNDIRRISRASVFHDIGKIAIPDEIINKPGSLTAEEFEIIKTHTVEGAAILKQIKYYGDDPLIDTAREICRWHHERYDGKGYPDGLVGDAIPVSAQAVSLADVYDALTSDRCYKKAYSHEKALEMILNGECGTFNPLLIECLTEIADNLPQKLLEAPEIINRRREDSYWTEELPEHSELSLSNKLVYQLQFEKTRADFFEKNTGGYHFTYRCETDELNLSEEFADLLDVKSTISNPSQNNELIDCSDLTVLQWKEIFTAESADLSEDEFPVTFTCGRKKHYFRCIFRSVWSNERPPRYLGTVGEFYPHSARNTEQGKSETDKSDMASDRSTPPRKFFGRTLR